MFESILGDTLTFGSVFLCIITSLVLGLIISYVHMQSERYSKNFIIVLSLLPLLVQVVIMMVNGNLGTSVAILGAFSLIRFRSMPGTSRELLSIFLAMAIGLSTGMGQIVFAFIFTVIASMMILIFTKSTFGDRKIKNKILKIVVPEDLDYTTIFDETLDKYTIAYTLNKSKTTNMGSLFELTYSVNLKDVNEKEFLDEIRCKNGNLLVMLSQELVENEL
ncbi:MAG: DUF4956 domain-containing protein [Bacilli bacterium]|nr:DUF4956 domain-containing protein [Bacilli bacterium]